MLDKVDYTQSGFILPIERNNVKGYASLNPEFYKDEDGLDFTGNYHVYLLHPLKGSMQFRLEPDANTKWTIAIDVAEIDDPLKEYPMIASKNPLPLEQDILDEIIQAIEMRKHSQGVATNVSNN